MKKVQLITMMLFMMLTTITYAGCGPIKTIYTFPSVNSNNVSVNTELRFFTDFNAAWPNAQNWCQDGVRVNTGYLRVFETLTNNQVDIIDINTFYANGSYTNQDTLTFQLNITLQPCTQYYVTLDVNSIDAVSCCPTGQGNFAGWLNSQYNPFTWTFTTEGISSNITPTIPTCNSFCDGSATANAQGGSGNYSFSWDDNQNQTTQTADNLCSGSYTVTIIDNVYGCTTNSNINISQPDQINVTYQSIPSTNGDGQIDINVSGGVPPYSYSWTNTSGFNSNSEDLQNLYAGTYTIVVTDANGCQESVDITVGGVAGLNNSELTKFTYSPNPCTDYLNISLNGEYDINIYDMSGKVVLNTFFVDNKALDVTSLDNGSYIIHLYNSEVNLKRNLIKQ